MNVYCSQHNATHRLTRGQAERVIYALSAEVRRALCEPDGERLYAGEDGCAHIPCPLGMLNMAGDIDGYGEHVSASVEARLFIERHAQLAIEGGASA